MSRGFPFLEDSRWVPVYGLLGMEDVLIFRTSMENSRAFSEIKRRPQGPKFFTGSESTSPTGHHSLLKSWINGLSDFM